MTENLSSLGLLMAGATSISNVIKDVSAKKVLERHEVIASTFWIRLFAAITFGIVLAFRAFSNPSEERFSVIRLHLLSYL